MVAHCFLIVDLIQVYSLKVVTGVGRYIQISKISDFLFSSSIVLIAAFFSIREFKSQADGSPEATEVTNLPTQMQGQLPAPALVFHHQQSIPSMHNL